MSTGHLKIYETTSLEGCNIEIKNSFSELFPSEKSYIKHISRYLNLQFASQPFQGLSNNISSLSFSNTPLHRITHSGFNIHSVNRKSSTKTA